MVSEKGTWQSHQEHVIPKKSLYPHAVACKTKDKSGDICKHNRSIIGTLAKSM